MIGRLFRDPREETDPVSVLNVWATKTVDLLFSDYILFDNSFPILERVRPIMYYNCQTISFLFIVMCVPLFKEPLHLNFYACAFFFLPACNRQKFV